MKVPLITVLMSNYNGEKYLREAIESVLCQTYRYFEFIIIDDASADSSLNIIKQYHDERIILIINKKNTGLAGSLNSALDIAHGKYIARMDSDDICFPYRLKDQCDFMECHPEVGLCGGSVEWFGDLTTKDVPFYVHEPELKAAMLFNSPISHSAVMIRASLLGQHHLRYDSSFTQAQDYDLWARIAPFTEFANLTHRPLLRYRIHSGSVSLSSNSKRHGMADRVRRRLLSNLRVNPTEDEFNLHHMLSTWQYKVTEYPLPDVEQWLHRLLEANEQLKLYSYSGLLRVLGDKWFYACNIASVQGMSVWREYNKSVFGMLAPVSISDKLRFCLKCVIKPYLR